MSKEYVILTDAQVSAFNSDVSSNVLASVFTLAPIFTLPTGKYYSMSTVQAVMDSYPNVKTGHEAIVNSAPKTVAPSTSLYVVKMHHQGTIPSTGGLWMRGQMGRTCLQMPRIIPGNGRLTSWASTNSATDSSTITYFVQKKATDGAARTGMISFTTNVNRVQHHILPSGPKVSRNDQILVSAIAASGTPTDISLQLYFAVEAFDLADAANPFNSTLV